MNTDQITPRVAKCGFYGFCRTQLFSDYLSNVSSFPQNLYKNVINFFLIIPNFTKRLQDLPNFTKFLQNFTKFYQFLFSLQICYLLSFVAISIFGNFAVFLLNLYFKKIRKKKKKIFFQLWHHQKFKIQHSICTT